MRFRVVCGLEVTMATFWPTSLLSSVDFPAFGRPMMATKPARPAGLASFPVGTSIATFICSSVSSLCFDFTTFLVSKISFNDRQFQDAGAVCVVKQFNVRRLCVFGGLFGHHSATVVILLCGGRVDAGYDQAEPAAFGNTPRKECEIVEPIFFGLTGGNQLFLSQ